MTEESTAADLEKWRWAFIERKADFISFDGWTSSSAREQVARGVKDGLLIEDESTSRRESDDQYTAVCFRPTDKLFAALKGTSHG